MGETRSVKLDQFLGHPPELVWRALTEQRLLARWLAPQDFVLTAGHRYEVHVTPMPNTGFDGVIRCLVKAFKVPEMLRIDWNGTSTVTWRLQPEGRGTRLFLTHDGFDFDDPHQQLAHRIMGQGWRDNIDRLLAAILADVE
jgi:uncharacterized protein YndB with AHSA1/START domain